MVKKSFIVALMMAAMILPLLLFFSCAEKEQHFDLLKYELCLLGQLANGEKQAITVQDKPKPPPCPPDTISFIRLEKRQFPKLKHRAFNVERNLILDRENLSLIYTTKLFPMSYDQKTRLAKQPPVISYETKLLGWLADRPKPPPVPPDTTALIKLLDNELPNLPNREFKVTRKVTVDKANSIVNYVVKIFPLREEVPIPEETP